MKPLLAPPDHTHASHTETDPSAVKMFVSTYSARLDARRNTTKVKIAAHRPTPASPRSCATCSAPPPGSTVATAIVALPATHIAIGVHTLSSCSSRGSIPTIARAGCSLALRM